MVLSVLCPGQSVRGHLANAVLISLSVFLSVPCPGQSVRGHLANAVLIILSVFLSVPCPGQSVRGHLASDQSESLSRFQGFIELFAPGG